MMWTPSAGEIVVSYNPAQRQLYEDGRPSEYDPWRWPADLLIGRNNRKDRCFPEVAVTAHFERRGYHVLLSAPKWDAPKYDERGFILFHYRGMRRTGHSAFRRMQKHFPAIDLNDLAELAYKAKRDASRSGGGGDPDLFVFRREPRKRFFVEVKDQDGLHPNQLVCFPIIEKYLCPVKIVRIHARKVGGMQTV